MFYHHNRHYGCNRSFLWGIWSRLHRRPSHFRMSLILQHRYRISNICRRIRGVGRSRSRRDIWSCLGHILKKAKHKMKNGKWRRYATMRNPVSICCGVFEFCFLKRKVNLKSVLDNGLSPGATTTENRQHTSNWEPRTEIKERIESNHI